MNEGWMLNEGVFVEEVLEVISVFHFFIDYIC